MGFSAPSPLHDKILSDNEINEINLGDDELLEFGAAPDYWFNYDSGNSRFVFNSTDVDGGGTNGTIWVAEDGSTKVEFKGAVSVAGKLITGDGLMRKITNVSSATYALLGTDDIIQIDYTTTGTVAVTLPDPSTLGVPANSVQVFVFKDGDGDANTNNITLTPAAGTVDGAGSVVISADYGTLVLYTDGSNYYVAD